MKLKKDSAVSSVVATTLILAILVIGVTIFMSTYLPDMKETSEIQNSADIRGSFLNYATTIENTYSTHEVGQYSRVINLGAGDVVISPSKSSGTLELTAPEDFVSVELNPSISGLSDLSCDSIDLIYDPVISFWRGIGYKYSEGTLTSGIDISDTQGTPYVDSLNNAKNGYFYNDTEKTLTLINFNRGTSYYKSGSGTAIINLKITEDTTKSGSYAISEPTTITINSTIIDTIQAGSTLKVIYLNAEVSIS